MRKNRWIAALSAGLLVVFAVTTGRAAPMSQASKDLFDAQTEVFGQVLGLYAEVMLDGPPELADCLQEMIAMRRLGKCRDKFSYFLTPEESRKWQEDMDGQFGGVGLEITQMNDRVIVVTPIENSPAEKAGFKPEDVLLAADGVELENIAQAMRLLRGKSGTKVAVKFWRKGFTEPQTVILTRANIAIISVKSREVVSGEHKISVIKVSAFQEKTSKQFENALEDARRQGINRAVLDFRNNPGGSLPEVVKMASLFMGENDSLLTYKTRQGEDIYNKDYLLQYFSIRKIGKFRDMRVVVLINKGSASASELFAGAMKDFGYPVLGEASFGKGVGQTCYPLSDESVFCLTTFEFLVGNHKTPIRDVGVKPTVAVKNSGDKNKDEQMDKAMEVLSK